MQTVNINFVSSKFGNFKLMVSGLFNIVTVTGTKLDSSFPEGKICIEVFPITYKVGRNGNGWGLMIYVRDDIPSKMLIKHSFSENIKTAFIEVVLWYFW